MIIANLLGKSKVAIMNAAEVAAWISSEPLDGDLVLNSDTKTWDFASSGNVIDVGAPVTTWRVDDTAPTGTSYYSSGIINHLILVFMINGVGFRIMNVPATAPNEIYYNSATGVFELQIDVTPAIQFNGEWISIIYNNDIDIS